MSGTYFLAFKLGKITHDTINRKDTTDHSPLSLHVSTDAQPYPPLARCLIGCARRQRDRTTSNQCICKRQFRLEQASRSS